MAVFVVVVLVRFLLPLAIPRYPLPAILGCLVVDAADQSIFQAFGYDPPGYQSYDKAMDVFYLALAYLATLRNWASNDAFRVSRFLYFYRLVGVVAFELTQTRALLLVFPNTFEYFFIAYEGVRSRWSTLRLHLTGWVLVAAGIWIFVKLPQEYWIHVAQLDVTDTLETYAWAWPLLIGLILLLAAVLWFVVRPRTPEPEWPLRLAADALPPEMDEAAERTAWHVEHGRVWSSTTLEKVVLVGLLAVIFSETLPGTTASHLQLLVGAGAIIVVNAALVLVAARRSVVLESVVVSFLVRLAVNAGLVLLGWLLLGRADLDLSAALFYVMLLSLLTTLHDRWLPVHSARVGSTPAPT